jgi:hypothetical protein
VPAVPIDAFEPAIQPFDTLEALITYEILDAAAVKHRFGKRLLLKAKQSVRFFEHTYSWTGRGRIEAPMLDDTRHIVHGPRITEGERHIYMIYLGRELVEDEPETIGLEQILIDQDGHFQPYLRFAVVNPLNLLTLRVSLPDQLRKNVRSEMFDLSRARLRAPTAPMVANEDGFFELVVHDPVVGVRYGIAWL